MIELTGITAQLAAMEAELERLPKLVRGRVMKSGVRNAMEPFRRKAQSNAESIADTGAMADALERGIRVIQRPKRGITYGIVGPASRFRQTYTDRQGRTRVRRPNNYSHLVEGQFRHTSGKTVEGPKPVTKAWRSTYRKQIPALVEYVQPRMEREAKKIARAVDAKRGKK